MNTGAFQQFLRESHELCQWSYRHPDRLQARMNEWAAYRVWGEEDVTVGDILLFRANGRFVAQFGWLVTLQTIPLLLVLIGRGASWPLALVLLGGTLLASYALALRYLRWALPLPWLATLFYMVWPGAGQRSLDKIMLAWPWAQMIRGWAVGYLLAALVAGLAWRLAQAGHPRRSNGVLLGGALIAGLIGGWIGTASLQVALVAAGGSAALALPLTQGLLARPLDLLARARLVGWVVAFAVGVPLVMASIGWWTKGLRTNTIPHTGAGDVVALLVGLMIAGGLTHSCFRLMPTWITNNGTALIAGLLTGLFGVGVGAYGSSSVMRLCAELIEVISETSLMSFLIVGGMVGLLLAPLRHGSLSVALALFLTLLATQPLGAGALLTLPLVVLPTLILAKLRPLPVPWYRRP